MSAGCRWIERPDRPSHHVLRSLSGYAAGGLPVCSVRSAGPRPGGDGRVPGRRSGKEPPVNRARDLREIAATAARAAADVPGVAYLTPRLTDRLHPAGRARTPGVRVLARDA